MAIYQLVSKLFIMSRIFILITTLLLLNGCGVEEDSSQYSNNIMAPLAGDMFKVLSINNEDTTISVKGVVVDPQGLPITLESVAVTGQSCEEPTNINSQDLTFTVHNTKSELCFYSYSVKNHPAQSSLAKMSTAHSFILKSSGQGSTLDPISETTNVETSVAINIDVPDYTLNEEVVVLGQGRVVVNSNTGSITFEPTAPGSTRLIYTVSKDDGSIMSGSIDIAVSDMGNNPPVAPNIDLPKQPSGDDFIVDEEYTIDLKDYVSDPDSGDELQLIEVKVWNAVVNVDPADVNNTSNLAFKFETSEAGEYSVSYLISDHRGGYGIGIVHIVVSDPANRQTWDDIQKGLKLFTAPLSLDEAVGSGITHTDSNLDSFVNDMVATFNYQQAVDYCNTIGTLPSIDNLKELRSWNLNWPQSPIWPLDLDFWATDNLGRATTFDLKTGAEHHPATSKARYVTCYSETGITIDSSSTLEAVADGNDKVTVIAKLENNGHGIAGEELTISPGNYNFRPEDTDVVTDSNGKAYFYLTSVKAAISNVGILYKGLQAASTPVEFTADSDNPLLNLAVITNNAQPPNYNQVEATLEDVYNNPLIGFPVKFSTDNSQVTINNVDPNTNNNGKQKANFTWNGGDTDVQVTATFKDLIRKVDISFNTSISMCGGLNDNDLTNAVLSCIKVAEDYHGNWFTAPPSQAAVEYLGYTKNITGYNTGRTYLSLAKEDGTYGPDGKFATFAQTGRDIPNPSDSFKDPGEDGQLDRWCQVLAEEEFAGAKDWRRPHVGEIDDFHKTWAERPNPHPSKAGVYGVLGWPSGEHNFYGSRTPVIDEGIDD